MSVSDAAPLPRAGEVFFDIRGNSRCMRLSWYADTGVAVFSIWQGSQCTGTFRLPIDELPRMVETLRTGPGAGSAGAAPPTEHREAPDAQPLKPRLTQVTTAGYQSEQSQAGYPDWPDAGYPDRPAAAYADRPGAAYPDQPAAGYPGQPADSGLPARPDWPAYPGQAAADYPGQAAADYPGQAAADYREPPVQPGWPDRQDRPDNSYPGPDHSAYPDQAGPAYPDQPGSAYPGMPGAGYPDQARPAYPDQPGSAYPGMPSAGYPDQPAASYPDRTAVGYPGQPALREGPAYPGRPALADNLDRPDADSHFDAAGSSRRQDGRAGSYPDDAGQGDHPRRSVTDSFATTAGSLNFPSVPSGWGSHDVRDSHDGRARRPDDSPSGRHDNRASADDAYDSVPPAESFPYGEPPDNLEPPQRRHDTRSSLR